MVGADGRARADLCSQRGGPWQRQRERRRSPPNCKERASYRQKPDWQNCVSQSLSAPQLWPCAQLGEQDGGAQRPDVQTWEPHACADVHGAPLLHCEEHTQRPLSHSPEAQSPLEPHCAPASHSGEQPGGAHIPSMHCCEAQSLLEEQIAPGGHFGAHPGGAHSPRVQTSDAQSVLALQGLPSGQVGAHVDMGMVVGVGTGVEVGVGAGAGATRLAQSDEHGVALAGAPSIAINAPASEPVVPA
jgi:hypothetical protein